MRTPLPTSSAKNEALYQPSKITRRRGIIADIPTRYFNLTRKLVVATVWRLASSASNPPKHDGETRGSGSRPRRRRQVSATQYWLKIRFGAGTGIRHEMITI